MIVFAVILPAIFSQFITGFAVVVALCWRCEARLRPAAMPDTAGGSATDNGRQLPNISVSHLTVHELPVTAAVRAGTRVGPAGAVSPRAPTTRGCVSTRHDGLLRQRRHLSAPAHRVIGDWGRR
jgi:hypothetical protein